MEVQVAKVVANKTVEINRDAEQCDVIGHVDGSNLSLARQYLDHQYNSCFFTFSLSSLFTPLAWVSVLLDKRREDLNAVISVPIDFEPNATTLKALAVVSLVLMCVVPIVTLVGICLVHRFLAIVDGHVGFIATHRWQQRMLAYALAGCALIASLLWVWIVYYSAAWIYVWAALKIGRCVTG